jgi:RNA-binding protein
MLNSRQRAYLKGLASNLEVILFVGRNGLTDSVADEAGKAFSNREIIKCAVQETCPLTAREACDALAEQLGAETVQAIGRRFVLYKPNRDIPAEKRIVLPK